MAAERTLSIIKTDAIAYFFDENELCPRTR